MMIFKSYSASSKKHLAILAVIICLALFVAAGCARAEPATTKQTTTGSATTGQTFTEPATTNSQIQKQSIFSKADCIVNGINQGATPDEFEELLGAPKEKNQTMDPVTGYDLLGYTYEGLQLTFKQDSQSDALFHLKIAEATSSGYRFAHNLQVGDSVQNVIDSFFHEENSLKYEGFTVLYGDPASLDGEEVTDEIAYGYYNDDQAYFLAMAPPYMSGHATIYDEMAILQFEFENQLITRIRWLVGAGAE